MRRELKVFLANPNALFGTGILLSSLLCPLCCAPLLYPGDPLEMVARPFLWPGQNPPIRSVPIPWDVMCSPASSMGRGSRLTVGLAATALGLTAGIAVGAIAGYFGGLVDDVLVKFIEMFQTIPSFVLLVVLVAIAQPTTATVTVAIAIVSWTTVARLTPCRVPGHSREGLCACRPQPRLRPCAHHLPRNPAERPAAADRHLLGDGGKRHPDGSALSFMGLGDPNRVSWGSMIGAGRDVIRTAWYLTALPGLAIVFTVLALNLIGDGLNDALNPRFSEER